MDYEFMTTKPEEINNKNVPIYTYTYKFVSLSLSRVELYVCYLARRLARSGLYDDDSTYCNRLIIVMKTLVHTKKLEIYINVKDQRHSPQKSTS